MTAETREEKLERLAELRIQKRIRDLMYAEADNLQTYRIGFEDGYDFRREQDNQYASTKAEEVAIGFIQWYFKQFPVTEVQNELYYKKAYKQYKQQ
ncbi:MAG TPA: hypothetical protein VMV77_04175 [Bacteroidales bacterium]|nr:hypothetical protein [Bacteroidales bacterium]